MNTPPSFVILLERDQQRVHNVRTNILSTLPECEIVSAVDGQTLTVPAALSRYSLTVAPTYLQKLTLEKFAATLSKLKVWNIIIERKLEQAIIFEDDVKVPPHFRNELEAVLNEGPDDYEYLFLWTHPKYRLLDDSALLLPGKRRVRKYSYTYGNLAYVLTLDGARKLTAHFHQ
jgi:GR25 family glycosyltransferase involved in LPS biosynthesis